MRLSDWAEVAHIQQLAVGANIPPGLPLVLSPSMGCGLAMVRFLSDCIDEMHSSPCNSSFFSDASVEVGTTQLRLYHACVLAYHLLSVKETHECMGIPIDSKTWVMGSSCNGQAK